jgi:hypothetical protein
MRSGVLHLAINGSHELPSKTLEKVLPKEEFSLVSDYMPVFPFISSVFFMFFLIPPPSDALFYLVIFINA